MICMDTAHCDDGGAADNLSKLVAENRRRSKEKGLAESEKQDLAEFAKKYRVTTCGQAFHIYCVTYPDRMWRRWCHFMRCVE